MQADSGHGSSRRGGWDKESAIHHIYICASSIISSRTTGGSAAGSELGSASTQNKKRLRENDGENGDEDSRNDFFFQKKEASNTAVDNDIKLTVKRTIAGRFTNTDMMAISEISMLRSHQGDRFRATVPWLVESLCPVIFGHELLKMGLLLGLFGGTQSEARHGHLDKGGIVTSGEDRDFGNTSGSFQFSTRSDIHVLVVGDPGLGKSQLLRAAATVAPKSVFVCGNTATTAGLTVSLSRDGGGGSDVCIEAGALVLADRGTCCIDELDKMSCDPHSMLEAMEQQQISIAKCGVVTSLKSRTTILAAANPVGGHYSKNKSVFTVIYASDNIKTRHI